LDPPLELAPVTAADPAIGEALARLGADEAELLRLWAWEELAPREIAEVLGISPNAVSLRLHRAKQKLADELRKNADPAGHEQVKGDTDG
ncbi:MAG: sigma-70 family RNA polymerase sigma factor, partial [Nocardioides sp.]